MLMPADTSPNNTTVGPTTNGQPGGNKEPRRAQTQQHIGGVHGSGTDPVENPDPAHLDEHGTSGEGVHEHEQDHLTTGSEGKPVGAGFRPERLNLDLRAVHAVNHRGRDGPGIGSPVFFEYVLHRQLPADLVDRVVQRRVDQSSGLTRAVGDDQHPGIGLLDAAIEPNRYDHGGGELSDADVTLGLTPVPSAVHHQPGSVLQRRYQLTGQRSAVVVDDCHGHLPGHTSDERTDRDDQHERQHHDEEQGRAVTGEASEVETRDRDHGVQQRSAAVDSPSGTSCSEAPGIRRTRRPWLF
jgi:hypothetical protein